MPNILVFGTGSIGAVYTCILSKTAQSRICCVCGSNYAAVKANGIVLTSSIFGERRSWPLVARTVPDATNQLDGPIDFIVVCTKATKISTQIAIEQVRCAISKETSLVIIQNGLGVEKAYSEAFPDVQIISGVAYLPTTQVSSGSFQHTEIEILHLGLYPSAPPSQPLHTFARLLQEGGATTKVHDDVQHERWRKIVSNGTINPICALSRYRDRELLDLPGGAILIKEVMVEIALVAASAGFEQIVTPQVVEGAFARSLARPVPGVQPSMMADALALRPMEVQGILGELVTIAETNGVAVPRLHTLFVLLQGLDAALYREGSALDPRQTSL